MSLTLGLNTALSGLLTSQRGLDVISQNVVNVNTPGYVRKTVNLESKVLAGYGAGVQETGVTRMVNEGLLKDLRRQNTNLGNLETLQDYYPRIDDLFGQVDDNTSIAHRVNELYTNFQTLTDDINRPAAQWATVQSAQDVATQMGSMTSQLQDLRIQADRDLESTVTQINDTLDNIHSLSLKIIKNGTTATGTADLEDQRDQALTDLSKLIDISYFKRNDGGMTVYTSSGQMLLDNQPQHLNYSAAVAVQPWMTAASGYFNTITVDGGTTDLGSEVTGGKMRALLDLRDSILPNLQANMDEMAGQLRDTINQIHNRGTSYPHASYRYEGARSFATQGDTIPDNSTNATFWYGGNTVDTTGLGGFVSYGNADATYPWRTTITSASGSWPAGMTAGTTFSINDQDLGRNSGTYKVVSVSGGVLTVDKVNPRQTMQLASGDDVVIATFDSAGNQVKQTTLNQIMQSDYAPNYNAATAGTGRSVNDFTAKADHGDWSINEVTAHIEGWLSSEGYSSATVNLNSDGKLIIDLGDTTQSLVFRDQVSSTGGAETDDVSIAFDINGDGTMDESVKGFSNFFGLNDFYVDDSNHSIMDSDILDDSYTTPTPRSLTIYDGSGQLGNAMSFPRGTSLERMAEIINAQTRTNESADLSTTSWSMTSQATITVSDDSGDLVSVTVPANGVPGTLSLEEIAGMLTQGTIRASVIHDGDSTRLRVIDTRGHELSVTSMNGAISGSSLNLGQTLGMGAKQLIQASVIPEGSGYRLRIRQTNNEELFLASNLDVNNRNLMTDLGMEASSSGIGRTMTVRSDILTAPERISRGEMQWNADIGQYFLSAGDNSTALDISQALQEKRTFDSSGGITKGSYSFTEYGAATISLAAQQNSHAKDQLEYQTTLTDSLSFQNSSFSGVNMDEEVAAMIDYQQAYAASAKVISTLKEMLQVLTDMV